MKINIRSVLPELIIILLFVLFVQTNRMKTEEVIKADAIGYYDYLPSFFIDHDLIRKDKPFRKDSVLYNRIDKKGVYVNYKGFKVDKYPVGTALLQWPFFYVAYLTTTPDGTGDYGYQKPFQQAVAYSALFYLFLALLFLRKLLKLYDIKNSVIIISEVLMVFATGVTNYANNDAGFSHIYSLFAITAFFYFIRCFFVKNRWKDFVFAAFFLGFILLLRQINVLVLFFIPFLAGSYENLKKGIFYLKRHPGTLLAGFFLTFTMISIQCLIWYLQTGRFLLYSYQGEGFHFLDPQFINILFSYRKGLFVYAPVLFLSLAGLIRMIFQRKLYQAFTWLLFFLLLTYLFSSWHSWIYGASYGSRVYVDYYSAFFIPFAILLNESSAVLKTVILLLSLLTIPVNLIQSYQYKTFILHWTNMNKEKYWKVFLKTDERYRGLLWKKNADLRQFSLVKEILIGNVISSPKNKFQLIYQNRSRSIPGFQHVSLIRISFANRFLADNNSKIIVRIYDVGTGKTDYWFDPYLIHFAQKQLGYWQTGFYDYTFKPMTDGKEKIISIKLFSEKRRVNVLKDFKIAFLSRR